MEDAISKDQLKEQIEQLELKQAKELNELKQQFKTTYTALQPINLVKSTIDEVVHTPGVEDQVISTIAGLVTGYVAKNIAFGKRDTVIKKLVADAVQLGVTTAISRHPKEIKWAIQLLTNFFTPHHAENNIKDKEEPKAGNTANEVRKTIMRQIMELMSFTKANHPALYQDLIIIPLPARDNNNQVSLTSLREYRNKLRLQVIQYGENKFERSV